MKFLLLSIGITGLLSFGTPTETTANAVFQKEFNQILNYPKSGTDTYSQETVFVSFYINEKGDLEILEINASSVKFAKYVEEKLKNIHLQENDARLGEHYNYKLTFKKV